jgi:histidyl-tRNA synthetase
MPSAIRPARGMRDFLPQDVRRRDFVIGVVEDVYRGYGFQPLETPALENIETLTGKYGEEGNRLIFKVLRRGEQESSGETDLALRYDLTVPLARVVAEHRGRLPRFFKRYQIQPVWRADRPGRGRFREFYQCDVDVIGSRSMVVEAELCAAVSDVLVRLGFDDFVIRINHRQVLSGLLEIFGISGELHGQALMALDKLDKIGPDGVRRELQQRGIGQAANALVTEFESGMTLERITTLVRDRPAALAAAGELEQIFRLADATGAASRLRFDVSLARGLSYYTGAIMEIAVTDLAGSLGGGGRYDGLIGMFLGEDIPASGFSLGLERILVVMSERGMFPPEVEATAADVLVTLFEGEDARDALRLARELRQAGVRVEVYPEAEKLGKQFKYAAASGVPHVAVLGSDERARGVVTIKDMRTGEQTEVPRADLPGLLAAGRHAHGSGRGSPDDVPRTRGVEP